MAVVPIDPSLADPQYCAYWIASRASRTWLSGVKKGATYIGIDLKDLRLLPVEALSAAAQMEGARRLDAFAAESQRLERVERRKLTALDELKRSLLHQAFSGGLTKDAEPVAPECQPTVSDT